MKKKDLPLLLMLVSGILCCIYTFILQYSTLKKLISLFIVMLIVYFLSSVMIWVVDCFKAESENQLKDEGEVIEKGPEDQEDTESQEGDQEETEQEESDESGMN